MSLDSETLNLSKDEIVTKIDTVTKNMNDLRIQLESIIFGQSDVIEQTLVTIFSEGHALIVGVPGLAKTKLMETIGDMIGLQKQRIQCTPDLMPADIIGTEVLETDPSGKRNFRFIEGPIFSQILMADEINRASPRTQSAMLQGMQEKTVTIAGKTIDLPNPFHVLATQNPIEQEGTYPLPEAQLDRFLMQININYPNEQAEKMMLITTTTANEGPRATLPPSDFLSAQKLIKHIPIGNSIIDSVISITRASRPESTSIEEVRRYVDWGAGPRAGQALIRSIKARAVLDGRMSPSIDDVLALANPILKHRMALNFSARSEGISLDDIIQKICDPYR